MWMTTIRAKLRCERVLTARVLATKPKPLQRRYRAIARRHGETLLPCLLPREFAERSLFRQKARRV